MRLALVMLLWTAFAGAQEAEVRTAPAAPTPPPILRRAAAPVPQGMAAAQPQGAPLPLYSIGQPTDEEQYYLELINRARANPTAEGVRLAATTDPDVTGAYDAFNVDLNLMKNEFSALAVRPPLAMNEDLMQAARAHSQDMFTNVFQGHGSTNGDDLGDRATDAGYNFGSLGENVFSFAESVFHGHAGFEVDWGGGGTGGMQAGRGHRMNIHGTFREVGIGVVKGTKTAGATTVGPQLVTQDFGTAQGATPLVTGVAYYDLNGNSFYDMGEGIGGLTVTVDGASVQAVTANTGGYAVPVPATNTSRAVTFSGLGVNSGGTATIAALANAKVDFAPAYVPPTVTGAASASTAGPSTYNFTVVGGAVSYEWRRATAAAAVTDTAANLSRVTVVKTGSYSELLSGRYHLAHATPPTTQSITYNGVFRASNGASVNFQSQLIAGTGEAARVQVSANDGLSWEDVYVQVGEVNEGGGNARSASLAAYEGKEIRLRFVYSFSSGGYFPASNGVGWFIDNIAFTNVTEISNAVTTSVPAGTTFDFTPPAVGDYVLAVRPVVTGGRALPYGPLLEVTGFSGPPPQAEVSLQQPAGTQLADAVSTVNYGPVNVGTPVVRTFTVANVGAEPLTGLAVSVDGANAGEFVAGALGAVSLSGGQSTTFTVTFTPAEVGARGAVLHLASNDGDENPFDVTLSGTGFAEPNITLQQPGGTNLTDGVSTVSYGTATLGVQTTRTFTIVNDGLLTLSGLAAVVEGTHAGDFAVGTPGMASLAPGQTTTFDVVFTPSAAGARVAVLRVASNDPDESPFDVTLSGTGSAQPVVLAPAPAAVMREAGGAAVIFAVTAIPDPLTYQWRKNGANIAGATVNSLTLNKPKLTDAGAYTVLVKRGTLSTISAVAQLGVVENVPKVLVVAVGGTATLKVSAAGNGLTYLWKRQDAAALPEARLGGTAGKKTTTNTLVIQKLDAATDSGVYRCEVTGPGGMVAGGTTELRVIDEGPVITTFDPPDGIVGGPYFAPVVMNGDADKTPTLFTATGLPPGLKMDPKTGNISGRPTKAGTYVIKLTASNSKGKTLPTPATVVIATFPDNVAGNYVGRVARSGLNGSLGGRIDLTVTPTGTFTGSLTMGVTKHALKGVLDIDVDQTAAGNPPRVVLAIPRAGKPAPTPLDLELEIDNNAFTANSKISADGDEAAIVGWRQVWHTTLNAAGAYEGYYTMIFRLGAAVAGAPQGSGYGSFKVAKDGKLTLAGRTADGELVTCAGFIGPSGQVVVYQALYAVAVKGSLLGQLQVGLAGVPADNTLSGALDWIRPPNLAASARIYELGFGNPTPVPLDAIGGKYTGAAATMILGLTTAGTDNARLVFTEGGVADSRRDPDVVLDVGLSNKITLPPVGAENEAGVKLTVAAATGIFSGTFVLDDPDPRKPPPATPVILKRTVTFQGMLVRDGTEQYGGGFFLLPKLPVGVQTPTTTDILSGKVVLEKAP